MREAPQSTSTSRRPGLREEAVFLDLLRTADMLSRQAVQVLKSHDISPAQYNVLRILRGCPDGLTCSEIASRMITRHPDITRLLDRMQTHELISRGRNDEDRRVVLTRITQHGLDLLASLDQPVRETHRKMLGHMGAERLAALSELLAMCRERIE